jgi:hypothetical protein
MMNWWVFATIQGAIRTLFVVKWSAKYTSLTHLFVINLSEKLAYCFHTRIFNGSSAVHKGLDPDSFLAFRNNKILPLKFKSG